MKKIKTKYKIAILIIICIFLIDFLSKTIIYYSMEYGDSIKIINDFMYISSRRNTGGAWSLFSGYPRILALFTLPIIGLFVYYLKDSDFENKKIYSIGLSLLIAGSLGNLFDRIVYGFVIDFIDFIVLGYNYPVFNIADIAIVVGLICFGYDILVGEIKDGRRNNSNNC